MGSQITREHTDKIIKKLKAENVSEKGDAHDKFVVRNNSGKIVAIFGRRRSSKKDIGHGHMPEELGVNAFFTKAMASCTKSRDDYLDAIGELDQRDSVSEEPKTTKNS